MTPPSFAARLMSALDDLERRYAGLVERSRIRNIDLSDGGHVVFIGFAEWDWDPDEALVAERTRLLADIEEWFSLFRLLHRSSLPETEARIEKAMELLRRWLMRKGGDHSIPSTLERAREMVASAFDELRSLVNLGTHGADGLLVVPDTNALMRCPDVADYKAVVGTNDFVAVLMPTVLAEIDDLKDRSRTPEVRDRAAGVVRRIKGLRDRGDLRTGVRVAGKTTLRAEHRDVQPHDVLGWLDRDVPDDRIVASALELQARHASGTVVLVTTDINLQNKAAAVGLPFVDLPH